MVKKLHHLWIIFLLSISSCSTENPITDDMDGNISQKKDNITSEVKEAKEVAESVIERYKDGSLKAEFQLVGGRKNGVFQSWHENGQVLRRGTMVNDRWDGDYREWRKDGTPLVQGIYIDGVQDGEWKFFDKNGKELPSVVFEMGVEVTRKLPKLDL